MTTSLPPSASDPQQQVTATAATRRDAGSSSAYHLLHPKVQRWIHDQGWDQLRDAQERAARPILAGDTDVIIAAATASGKTEAAWLPICSAAAARREASDDVAGIGALYVGPLKALINDQYERLTYLCERLDVPVHRWHGDVAGSRKSRVLREPDGILLITPESLESLFVNHGDKVARILGDISHVVIDELHAFIGTERGAQLQSLLHRVDLVLRRRIPRIALSATLGDFTAAAAFLRPGRGDAVTVIASDDDAREIRLQLRGYVAAAPRPPGQAYATPQSGATSEADDGEESWDKAGIADHLFRTLRGSDNLVFANSRSAVELYTDMLDRRCKNNNVPSEFLPHHGNLSKEIREHVEARLKDRTTPVTAICTSTLEMGIDIGSVDSVAQIGAPASVAGMRQRLGRSGRRADQPAVLRMYVSEPELTDRTPPTDTLRSQLVQSVAMVDLLLAKWYEPPDTASMHLSTLTQQVLSVIAQRGGAQPQQLYDALSGHGPFARVDKSTFIALLRCMGKQDLLTQDSQGLLLPGGVGDRLVNHYSFYTAFTTPEEFRLVADGRTIGSLPVDNPITPGMLLIFSGRRWKIVAVDARQKVIELVRSGGGRPPGFSGSGGEVADAVRQRMRMIYQATETPRYLDRQAQALLEEGRAAFNRYGLDSHAILGWGNDTLLFPWRGDKIMNTLAVALTREGLEVGHDGVALTIRGTDPAGLWETIRHLADETPPDPPVLAAAVPNKAADKYDQYLTDDLLTIAYAARALDVPEAWHALRSMAAMPRPEQACVLAPETVNHDRSCAPPAPGRSAAQPVMRPLAQLGQTPFAVIDLETTGFASHRGDRIVEVAVVRLSPAGQIEQRWATLINPDRDPGPTHVHGLTAADLALAPRFSDIAGELANQLRGAIVVAHNARYDLSFLDAEFHHLGYPVPAWPALCTLSMSHRYGGGATRRLTDLCLAEGIPIQAAHSALGDATATAQLLKRYLNRARQAGVTDLAELGCHPLELPLTWAAPTGHGATLVRPSAGAGHGTRKPNPHISLAGVAARVEAATTGDSRADAYFDVLDRALADHVLSHAEVVALLEVARTWGLSSDRVHLLHQQYLAALLREVAGAGSPGQFADLEAQLRTLTHALESAEPPKNSGQTRA
ncbi:DEAD/DEAH box helicase [Micromonospora antibiotica]|uniref:DEAD/DEAH box helicase n=1 Tax=Micromonospora antibiotica TaxID=2807623 RepID=A0ABS3V6L2_9ACTN|nr:DEAD/DEAH box helicase [Micromonospora antibiotica]MBO4161220.1 DEAD/DEAH box helicase [Micromonospora antibiotica]